MIGCPSLQTSTRGCGGAQPPQSPDQCPLCPGQTQRQRGDEAGAAEFVRERTRGGGHGAADSLNGHGAADSLNCLKFDLQQSLTDAKYIQAAADRAIIPDLQYVER